MAIPQRHKSQPGTYFVSSRSWESRQLFRTESLCSAFVEALRAYRTRGIYQLHAFVLMPEHFHVMITPATDTSLERAVQYIKGGSAHRIGFDRSIKTTVWQRGFSDHRIRDVQDYETHLRYIEENPVKRGLVERAAEYQWGSASGLYALDPPPQWLKPLSEDTVCGTAKAVP